MSTEEEMAAYHSMLMQAVKICGVLTEISNYREQVSADWTIIPHQNFIDKWQPAYNRIMQMKAFL